MTRPNRISPRGQKRLSDEEWTGKEGLRADGRFYVYKDYKGFNTIGIGHLVKPGEDFSKGLTLDGVVELNHKDLGDVYAAILRWVTYEYDPSAFDSMCLTGHNCGVGFFYPPNCTAIRCLNAGDVPGYQKHLLDWNKSGGHFDPNLYARRQREAAWFVEPPPGEDAVVAPLIPLEPIAMDADDAARRPTDPAPPDDAA